MSVSHSPRIDLRSDTVTTPTETMRRAMAEALVGDDVYAEDPTVNELQQEAARLLGFEAGLFMPSGTMTNQVAIAVHTQRGQEVICAEGSHIYEWELGMMAAFSGVVPRFVVAPRGVPDPEGVRRAIRRSIHQSPTGLISLENTHNKAGGTVLPQEVMVGVREVDRGYQELFRSLRAGGWQRSSLRRTAVRPVGAWCCKAAGGAPRSGWNG